MYRVIMNDKSEYIFHSGTKGMRWHRRLYQYPDGTLTPLGKIHDRILRKRNREKSIPARSPAEALTKEPFVKSDPDYLKAHDSTPLSQISTKDLQTINNRLQLEYNYKNLINQHILADTTYQKITKKDPGFFSKAAESTVSQFRNTLTTRIGQEAANAAFSYGQKVSAKSAASAYSFGKKFCNKYVFTRINKDTVTNVGQNLSRYVKNFGT